MERNRLIWKTTLNQWWVFWHLARANNSKVQTEAAVNWVTQLAATAQQLSGSKLQYSHAQLEEEQVTETAHEIQSYT